jgi:hypothetical protein
MRAVQASAKPPFQVQLLPVGVIASPYRAAGGEAFVASESASFFSNSLTSHILI